jgi:hypothetical protein
MHSLKNQNPIENTPTDKLNEMFQATLLWRCVFEHVKGLKTHEFRAAQLCLGWIPTTSSSYNNQHNLNALGVKMDSDMIYLEDLEFESSFFSDGNTERIFSLLKQCITSAQSEAMI